MRYGLLGYETPNKKNLQSKKAQCDNCLLGRSGLAAFGRVVATVPGRMAVRTAGVVAFATTSTILAAILVGVGAPLLLDAVGVDPCNCASPALATAVDLLGVVFLCVTGQRFLK